MLWEKKTFQNLFSKQLTSSGNAMIFDVKKEGEILFKICFK